MFSIALPDADIILRSSDGWNFHLTKQSLRDASPHFRSMFAIPFPPSTKAQLQTIDIDLVGDTLWLLIRLILDKDRTGFNAILATTPRTIDSVLSLMSAADKLEFGAVEEHLRKSALPRACKKERNPIRAWAVAKVKGLDVVAREAETRYLLSIDDFSSQWDSIPELAHVSARDFNHLMERRKRAIVALRSDLDNYLSEQLSPCEECAERGTYGNETEVDAAVIQGPHALSAQDMPPKI